MIPYTGKLSYEEKESIIAYLKTNITRTAEEVRDWVESNLEICFSRSGITALLHTIGFSYKTLSGVSSKANKEEHVQFKTAYENLENNLEEDAAIVFADAMHIKHNNSPCKAWIFVGEEKYIPTNSGRKTLNLHGVYNPNERGCFVKSYETINQDSIIDYYKELSEEYKDKRIIYVITDNAGYYINAPRLCCVIKDT